MFISVIIPTYNRNDLLIQCLDCLNPSEQVIPAVDYEFIVTDDSKNNGAKQLLQEKYPWVKWIEGPKSGPAANRNNGVKLSKGQWVVFLDDDCLPKPGWLNAYYEAIVNSTDTYVFEGCTDAERPKKRFDEESPINLVGGYLWSCNFAISKEVFNSINGFDETFPYAALEDVDFHNRIQKVATIRFVKNALVIHPWRRIKPFSTFKKQLKSHRHFAEKYNLLNTFSFRWLRAKIFIGGLFINFKQLRKYSMRGWKHYLEMSLLNFCIIFM